MRHAVWGLLLGAGTLCSLSAGAKGPEEIDAALQRALYPDLGIGGAGAQPVQPSEQIEDVLERKLHEPRDVLQRGESLPLPEFMAAPESVLGPGPRMPMARRRPAAVVPRGGGGQFLVQGERLPEEIQREVSDREQKLERETAAERHVKTPGAVEGEAIQESLQLWVEAVPQVEATTPPAQIQAAPQGPPAQVAQPTQRTVTGAPARPVGQIQLPSDATISFVGQLEDVSAQTVWVRDGTGKVLQLAVNRETQAFQNGRQVEILQLHEGKPVSVSYELTSGRPVATSLIMLEK